MAKKLKKAMEAMMSPEAVEEVSSKVEKEALAIRLAQLREKCGVKQGQIENFNPSKIPVRTRYGA